MTIESLKQQYLTFESNDYSENIQLGEHFSIQVYQNSVNEYDSSIFLIGREDVNKYLYILSPQNGTDVAGNFDGEPVKAELFADDLNIIRCPLNHYNAVNIQNLFEFTRPVLIGIDNSFGFGDRLGLANPAHVRALNGYHFKPIFPQQSIRELTRTHRSAEDVMDAAVWAVFQEGYKDGFGADGDHLKTTEDIDRLAKAGYKFFTFDPSEHVNNDVEDMQQDEIKEKVPELNWEGLQDTYSELLARYENKKFRIMEDFAIEPGLNEIRKAILKYGNAFIYIKKMYEYLKSNYSDTGFEVEVSVDESYTVTTPFEHFFFVNELKRLGVEIISLAPRFIGGFEKGIDYKGDIEVFKREYLKHAMITEYFGNYKLSVHSGSDKFAVYRAIASVGKGHIHVKTAGTSYLEALKVVATHEPDLFKKILEFSKGIYREEKKSYHVSAEISNLKSARDYNPQELIDLFNSNDARQILHVAYGRVLTEKNSDDKYIFREQIYDCLEKHEDTHYQYLIKHFKKHLDPLEEYIVSKS